LKLMGFQKRIGLKTYMDEMKIELCINAPPQLL
jgi:hypothetical protein